VELVFYREPVFSRFGLASITPVAPLDVGYFHQFRRVSGRFWPGPSFSQSLLRPFFLMLEAPSCTFPPVSTSLPRRRASSPRSRCGAALGGRRWLQAMGDGEIGSCSIRPPPRLIFLDLVGKRKGVRAGGAGGVRFMEEVDGEIDTHGEAAMVARECPHIRAWANRFRGRSGGGERRALAASSLAPWHASVHLFCVCRLAFAPHLHYYFLVCLWILAFAV
jgi:hypothetical protein